ncbi:DNA primase [Bacillus oleivorans]|uniref:DNA primase n=1 Tax=Bacillus oleivorans TaxID=1448271 RepID=A0A285CJW9_9BACI|nr:DNA primase [Bacillus oleivorans]
MIMSERLSDELIDEIRASADIVDVISEYVQLKKKGRNYFGLCPFHGENTPSFSVAPDKQIFHCFGCGAGGNVFSFLMDIDGLSFIEAVQKIAERTGKDIPALSVQTDHASPKTEKEKQLFDLHELLNKFYHHLLVNTKEGQKAYLYLENRGISKDAIDTFQIGYAPGSWDFVKNYLEKKGFSHSIIEESGIIVKSTQGDRTFDRFRNRIMFPIHDHSGNTVAFSGRVMETDGNEPKFLNSPETPIFKKGNIFYNFHRARPEIRKKDACILFEGYADVISAFHAGIKHGIATMGTSLSDEHIKILKRNVSTAVLCFDSDDAGVEATYRAGRLLEANGITVLAASIPNQLDPDEFIRQYGGERFQTEVVDRSQTFMSFKLSYLRRGKNLMNEGERLLYIEEVLKEISKQSSAIEKDHYLRQLANEFSLSLEALKEQEKQYSIQQDKSLRKQQKVMPQQISTFSKKEKKLAPAYVTAEKMLLSHMLQNDQLVWEIQKLLQNQTFNIDEHQAIFTYLAAYYEEGNSPDVSQFLDFIKDQSIKRLVTEISLIQIQEELTEPELNDYIMQVLKQKKLLMIKEKEREEREAESSKDYVKAARIAMEILQLRKTL